MALTFTATSARCLASVIGLTLALCCHRAGAQPVAADCPPPARALSTAEIEAGQREAIDRGFLWRIARDGRVSYLYGTLHIAQPRWMFPGPQTLQFSSNCASTAGSSIVPAARSRSTG